MLWIFVFPLCMLWCDAMFSTQSKGRKPWLQGAVVCLCSEPAWQLGSFLLWKCKAGGERITSMDIYICCTISASYISSLSLSFLSFFAFDSMLFLSSPSATSKYLPISPQPFSPHLFSLLLSVFYSLFLSLPPFLILLFTNPPSFTSHTHTLPLILALILSLSLFIL